MKKESGTTIYSPSDLIRYLASPFASWLDRYNLENPGSITPDEETEEEKLLSRAGDEHERSILTGYKTSDSNLVEILKDDFNVARTATLETIKIKTPIIFQAALQDGVFAGFADFLILDGSEKYQVWDTKLALSPKPYYPVQLCCYSEMLAATTGHGMPERIGIILGNGDAWSFASKTSCIITAISKTTSWQCRPHLAATWITAQSRFRALSMDAGLLARKTSFSRRIIWFKSLA